MKYAITGGAGHISKPLIMQLLGADHQVIVISRNETHMKELVRAGAETAIGSLEDVEFLKKAFAGADAVYTMCPPNVASNDLNAFCAKLGKNYAEAIIANDIRYVVNLSSVGAHLQQGAGHIAGMRSAEQALNTLPDVNIKHLRPVYFYTNLLANIDMIKNMGIMGSNFSIPENKFPIVAPTDIAYVAAEELLGLNFSGHTVRYIASDETSTDQIANVLGKAIGKPELKWIQFTDEQAFQGMIQAGLPKDVAGEFVEGFNALHTGKLTEDYWKHHPKQLGAAKLEEFAEVFAQAYNSK